MALKDIARFDIFSGKELLKNLWEKPDQTLLGAQDPLGAMFWSKVTGKKYEPNLNIWGGPSDQTYATPGISPGADMYSRAERAGIDTKSGEQAHDVAEAIAGVLTAAYGGGQLMQGMGTSTPIPDSVNLVNAGGSMSTGSAGTYGANAPVFNMGQLQQVQGQQQGQQGKEAEQLRQILAMLMARRQEERLRNGTQ